MQTPGTTRLQRRDASVEYVGWNEGLAQTSGLSPTSLGTPKPKSDKTNNLIRTPQKSDPSLVCCFCLWQKDRKNWYHINVNISNVQKVAMALIAWIQHVWHVLSWRQSVSTRLWDNVNKSDLAFYRPQRSQLVEPLWTDPGIKSGTNVRELISLKVLAKAEKNPPSPRDKNLPLRVRQTDQDL